eukprot:TRINITY_DN29799_c0_g1_i1.p1 TRINITY_DN29799_c0_g1~~TRINITY_DN29799_c0_g1_i1.p1  ORF type:complete len:166 (-),score=40.81 TRINITY_DN29799_c0_g1_i1:56-514(-)
MPAGGDGGTPSRTQSVQEQVNGAMSVMQDNMRAMAERDSQLHGLEGKTNDLQGASKAFSSGAKRLQQHYQWQRYKMYIIIGGSVLWVITVMLMPKQYLWQFIFLSALILGIGFAINALLARRDRLAEAAAEAAGGPATAELGESLAQGAPLE